MRLRQKSFRVGLLQFSQETCLKPLQILEFSLDKQNLWIAPIDSSGRHSLKSSQPFLLLPQIPEKGPENSKKCVIEHKIIPQNLKKQKANIKYSSGTLHTHQFGLCFCNFSVILFQYSLQLLTFCTFFLLKGRTC